MDNATFHKQSENATGLRGCRSHSVLYLPPYSPDLNPIEKKWAQIKALRRKVGGSIDALFSKITT
jgi:transposase